MSYVRARRRRASADPRQLELPFGEASPHIAQSLIAPDDDVVALRRRRSVVRAGVRPVLAGVVASLAFGDGEAR